MYHFEKKDNGVIFMDSGIYKSQTISISAFINVNNSITITKNKKE